MFIRNVIDEDNFTSLMYRMYTFYVIRSCPYCRKALDLARKNKLEMTVKYVKKLEKEMYKKRHKMQTFPQIFYHDRKIGGYDSLSKMF